MSIIKQLNHLAGIQEGVVRSRRKGHSVLVSQTQRIPHLDPLLFFEAGVREGETRNFWADPDRELILVGLGTAWKIELGPEANNRYREVEKRWRLLLRDAVQIPEDGPRGTGPLLMGGFSFDPLQKRTPLWKGFPEAAFTLPRFLLTVYRGTCLLTVNVVVKPGDQAETLAEMLAEEEEKRLGWMQGVSSSMVSLSYHAYEVEPDRWKQSVSQVAQEIQAGKMDKLVLAREIRLESEDAFASSKILNQLWKRQPSSFLFAVEREGACFLGASPERLVKRDGDRLVSTCIAGTTRRGRDWEEDWTFGQELLSDPKNRVEHQVVVEMIREAFQQGCSHVRVPEEPTLYQVRDVQHLFTPVEGRAKLGTTLLSMVEQLHPTPALGGYPREVAMTRIRELEVMDRGWYAAPLGWVDFRGDGEFACGIRSGLIRGQTASLFAGCGIVGDSDPNSEYEETRMKFRPMLSAIGGESR